MTRSTSDLVDEQLAEALELLAQAGAPWIVISKYSHTYRDALVKRAAATQRFEQDSVKSLVREAVVETLALVVQPTTTAQQEPAGKGREFKRARGVKRAQVSIRVAGGRTTLTLPVDLYEEIVAAAGDEAHQLITSFAQDTPAEHGNRSAWVEAQVEQHLAGVRAAAAAEAQDDAQRKH